jgi:hypothetical protein
MESMQPAGEVVAKYMEIENDWRGPAVTVEEAELREQGVGYFKSFYKTVFSAIQPSCVCLWNGHHPQEVILREIAEASGCGICFVERAPFSGFLHFDKLGVLAGSSVAAACINLDLDEPLKSDLYRQYQAYTVDRNETWWGQPNVLSDDVFREKYGIPVDKKIVLFAGQVEEDIQNLLYNPHFDNGLTAFEAFITAIRNRDDVFVLGKHHPQSSLSCSAYQEVVGTAGIWTSEAALENCLRIATHVASVNSTVIIEALVADKPVLMLGESLLSNKDIAYEYKQDIDLEALVHDWLDFEGFELRKSRWSRYGNVLLSKHFYSMNDLESSGFNGAERFAARLSDSAIQCESMAPVRLDSLLALSVGARRKSGSISTVNLLKLLLKRLVGRAKSIFRTVFSSKNV